MVLDDDRTGEHGTVGAASTCTNCGDRPARRAFTLRFEREELATRELDLQLCHHCLDDICSEPDVERVERA